MVDMSRIDFAELRDEFAGKVRRKHAVLQGIREVVEKKLAQMLAHNPTRMDYYKKKQEIIADYNREKDRVTVEATRGRSVADSSRAFGRTSRRCSDFLSRVNLRFTSCPQTTTWTRRTKMSGSGLRGRLLASAHHGPGTDFVDSLTTENRPTTCRALSFHAPEATAKRSRE
jgi:hypothetical protein